MADARRRVLIVDDDAGPPPSAANILSPLGVSITAVTSAAEAQRVTKHSAFDLALVEVRLPDGSGIELLETLRARSPWGEVVLMTGHATVESAIAAVHGGAFAYLLKPVSPPDLLDTARRALAQVDLRRERELLAAELARSERTHREVVEAVPALVLALDRGGRIRLWNRRLEELTGFHRSEMIGQPGEKLVRGGGVRLLPSKQGVERLVRWERAEMEVAGAEDASTYAIGADVTAEQEMLRRTLRAERLAAVGTLAAGLAHEVRNPLNSALLQLQVLGRRLDRGEVAADNLRPIVGLVEEEIRRLDHLVSDFLAFVQPRPLELQPTALAEVCLAVLAFVAPEAEAVAVRTRAELAQDLPPLAADPERLRQVLMNLMLNAIEAMPDGGALVVRTRAADGAVEIDVEDSGAGFPGETPIFDAFFTTKPKGTGLGLTIVHRIVTDHGGTVRVRSRPGSTCFTVSLPAHP